MIVVTRRGQVEAGRGRLNLSRLRGLAAPFPASACPLLHVSSGLGRLLLPVPSPGLPRQTTAGHCLVGGARRGPTWRCERRPGERILSTWPSRDGRRECGGEGCSELRQQLVQAAAGGGQRSDFAVQQLNKWATSITEQWFLSNDDDGCFLVRRCDLHLTCWS